MKRALWGMALLLLASFPVAGEQTCSVSGTVVFDEGDRIFVSLYSHEAFENFERKPLPPEPFTIVIEPGAEEKKAGRVPFRFEGIPRGTYALLAFRDPGKPGSLQPLNRPASHYRMMSFSGRWEDVKFDVNRNLTGLEIRFERKGACTSRRACAPIHGVL